MNIEERIRRCNAAPLHYHPDRVGCLCRVYGRWVRDCYDCAFNVHGSHTGAIEYNRVKTRQQIEERLNKLHIRYRTVSSDNIDPELEAQIRELRWVLDCDKYISHDG